MTGYSGPIGPGISLGLFVEPFTDIGGCYDTAIGVATPDVTADAEQVIGTGDLGRLTPRSSPSSDPTFIDTVAVVVPVPTAEFDCLYRLEALGQLTWDFPDLRPGLRVVDGGLGSAPRVRSRLRSGAPSTYTVALVINT